MGINQDLFGTFAMKRGSVLGPFYQKLVLLRYFPKFGTHLVLLPASPLGTLGPETGPFARVRKTGLFAVISLPSVSQMALV